MNTVLLIRHALTDDIGRRLSGRAPGVPLCAEGLAQAQRLARRLAVSYRLSVVYTSPLERARRTAAAIAERQGAALLDCDGLLEIDFGRWTGRSFEELQTDPDWQRFNARRTRARVPGGERPQSAQLRAVRTVAMLAARHQGEVIGLVSHGDLIRFALLHYRSISLDRYADITIDPASVSVLQVIGASVQVRAVNDCAFAA